MSLDDPLIGKKLGDYTIQGLLGRGGMSRVYRGYDENLQRYAAVKVISGDFATTTEEEYTKRFTSEARAIAHLRHANIVGVYQFGRTEGIYYMAQVFLEGRDLRQLLKEYADQNQRMPAQEIVRIVGDVADALDYAHEQGVIHRDIKPSNIMLEKRTGRAILMDFGLALSVHEGTMGDTFGSAHYIAPEQAVSSAKAVPQSDLYSLGVVIYEMVAGKVPFDDPSVMSVALKHLNELPPPPTMYNPDLPTGVEAVIMRVLDKDPKRRYPTGQALVDDLKRAFSGEDGVAAPPVVPPTSAAGLGVLDMLDSTPSAPSRAEPEFLDHPKPRISTSSAKTDELVSGAGGRFARRRAQREDAAGRQLTDDDLVVDDDTLGSLLDSMPDPSDIGLTGENAIGVTPTPRSYMPGIPEPLAESEPTPAKEEKERRSRIGIFLPVILVLVVLVGGLIFGSQFMGGGDDGPTETEQTATALAIAAVGDDTDTPEATEQSTEVPTADSTEESTQAPTGESTASPTDAEGTEVNTLSVTDEATEVPTEEPTVTAEPTAEPTATDEPTQEPTVTPTEEPTVTDEPTEEPTVTPTEEPTAIDEPTGEPTEPAVTAVAAVVYRPNVRVEFNPSEFILYNISGETIDISNLVFEQELRDGRIRRFTTTTWTGDVVDEPDAMRKDSCYQLITSTATQNDPDSAACPLYQGYFRSNVSSRYFWIGEDESSVFTVRVAGAEELLATCLITDGACEFYAGPEESAVVIEPSVVPPTPMPGMEPNVRLIYDRDKFILVNTSDEVLDISRLIFEQVLPTGSARVFLTAEWDDNNVMGSTSSLPGGACYELVSSEGAWVRPNRTVCVSFLGWFRSNLSERYFWRSSRSDVTTFTVYQNDRSNPVMVCEIAAGECDFYLPPE